MRNEWMEIFSQEGYRFCKVKPEETGVFYKYYEEGFHLVIQPRMENVKGN